MSNTSTSNDKTVVDNDEVKLIIGEIGRDTKTGIIGRGYSFDNGNTFHVTDTIYGRLYTHNDADGLWNNGLHEKVKEKVNQEITNTVEPAINQADSAVAYANDAIEKSRVNCQAIVDINSAVSDAVSDAAVARSDGLRAWNAAQSNVDLINQNYASASAAISSARTEAIAAADEAKASASAAQADIVAVRSDVAAAKSDIADTKTSLTSQAKNLSSYAAQASAVGEDITTLKSQAGQLEQDMADTKGDVSQLKLSASSASAALSDAAGNISSLQTTAKSYSAALSDTNSNVASVTATASELETKYADAAGDINQIKADAKSTAETIADAQGDIAILKKRADGFDAEFTTANGNISKLQTDASGTKETLTNAKNDIAVLQSQLKVQADQIASKVSSSDLDAKGYATQTYTQTQIKQTSDSWNANLTSVKNGLTKSYTNLSASVDGIKADVYNSDGSSKIVQLSDVIATKVSQGDYNSQITQLQNDINLRVTKGNVISQINQEAGGNTLIQVSNGKGSLILDAGNTVITGKAWIPVASIADLTADQIQAGTLTGSTVHLGDSNGNTIDLGVLGTNHVGLHSSAQNGDQTYIDSDGIHNYGVSYDTKINQGKITTNYMAVNGGLIDFRSDGAGVTFDKQDIKFYNSSAVNGGISFSGSSPIADVSDGTTGNELHIRYDRSFALTPISSDSARICASTKSTLVGYLQSGKSTPDQQTTGLYVDGSSRRINLGVWGADSTWARVEASTHNIHMQADKAHAWLSSDNVFHIYKDGDSSSTATQLKVDGWAWVNGWVEAAGHSQHSALSTKTDIQPVDDDKMLKMINGTDLTTFLYKTEVANGDTHRHIGLIIDDVHDVAQYQTPQDFIAPNGVSRDDDNMIGALFGAVKALTKRIKTLESKVG